MATSYITRSWWQADVARVEDHDLAQLLFSDDKHKPASRTRRAPNLCHGGIIHIWAWICKISWNGSNN